MGVYLSAPITEKVSVDKTCKNFVYGASSMQGWRMTQEDAHNCCPDFDPDRNGSLFAVYDGHGGAEVALYAALHLPDFIKSLKSYQDGDYRAALEEAFLRFDATLVDDKVIEELKGLAGEDPGEDEGAPEAVGKREADMLCAEANMPLDELLAKYEPASGTPLPLRDIRKKENILSPVVHNKHRFLEKGDCSADSPSGDGDSHIDFTRSSSLVTNLQGKLSNGHAENENNLNTEKEMQNNQNQNRNTQEAELSSSVTSELTEVKTAVEESPAADSSTSHTMKRSSKGSSVSSSSSTTKDFVSSSVEQQSSISEEPVCQSSGDIPSGNNSIQSDSCSQTSSCQENARVCGDSKVDDCSGPHSSSDCPSSSSDVPKSSSQDKADSSGNEVDAVSSRGDRDGPTDGGSDDRVGNEATGSEGDGVDSGKEASCSKKTLQETSGSGDGPCGSGSLDGPSSSVEGEEAGGSSSGAGGSGSQSGAGVTDRPDLITGDDSDDDDDDDDEYQEDSEEDFEDDDDDDEEEEEEEGEIDGTGFQQCVDMSNEEPGSDSGCTACLALFLGKDLWVANAGDSRCVLSRAGKAVDLSFDHKPEDDIERKRIEKAGGKVTSDGRVNGGLNLSRALGDHYYKRNEELPAQEQMITALPDIEHVTIGDDDEFVVIACDGIWNYMSSEDVISMVGQELKDPEKRKKPSLICEKMFDHCLAPNTFGDGTGCDNMTCIIIVLKPQSISSSSEASKRCAGEMDSCSSTEDGLAEKRTKLDSSTSGVDDTV